MRSGIPPIPPPNSLRQLICVRISNISASPPPRCRISDLFFDFGIWGESVVDLAYRRVANQKLQEKDRSRPPRPSPHVGILGGWGILFAGASLAPKNSSFRPRTPLPQQQSYRERMGGIGKKGKKGDRNPASDPPRELPRRSPSRRSPSRRRSRPRRRHPPRRPHPIQRNREKTHPLRAQEGAKPAVKNYHPCPPAHSYGPSHFQS